MIVLHNRRSLSSKPRDSIIFWTVWCVLLPQRSILHDFFTVGFNGKRLGVWKLLATTVVGILEHGLGLQITYTSNKERKLFQNLST